MCVCLCVCVVECVCVCDSSIIILTSFLQQMINLYRDPTGENIFDKSLAMSTIEIGKGGAINVVTDKDRIASLESQIQELRSRLELKEVCFTTKICLLPM